MAERVECFVTGSLEKGPAFALRSDNSQAVFIPSKIAERLNLVETDRVICILIPNKVQPEKTPFFAESAVRVED